MATSRVAFSDNELEWELATLLSKWSIRVHHVWGDDLRTLVIHQKRGCFRTRSEVRASLAHALRHASGFDLSRSLPAGTGSRVEMVAFKFCRYERQEQTLVIYLTNSNVICGSGELELELVYLINRFKPRQVHIDFSQVVYCSREAINDLLTTRRRLLSAGGQMDIRAMSPQVRNKFRSLKLDGHVFHIMGQDESESAAEHSTEYNAAQMN